MIKTWSTPVAGESSRIIPCALCGGTNGFVPHFTCTDDTGSPFSYVRCVHCGLVQINPQPDPAAIRLRYGNAHGKDYLEYEKQNEAAFLRLQMLSLEDAGFFTLEQQWQSLNREGTPRGVGRVLDIGCATGALLAELKRRGWECCGVELSNPQADYCRKRGLDVRDATLEDNHFPDKHFDTVLASHLIEHLNDPASFVREVFRVLAPGGRFYVTTPNISGFQARLFGSRWRSAIFDHLYLFSIKTLRTLLERNGFAFEKIITWGGLASGIAPRPVKQFADHLAKRIGAGDVMMLRARKPD